MENVISSAKLRTYPVPQSVVAEAKKGLEWAHAYPDRFDAPSRVVATVLASGGSLTADYISMLNDYFTTHQSSLQASGFMPGNGYPASERVNWAMWGGSPGKSWARKIAREMRKSYDTMVASALSEVEYDPDGFAYIGLLDISVDDEDIVRDIVRVDREDNAEWAKLNPTEKTWEQLTFEDVSRYEAVELDEEMTGFVSSALISGASGVVVKYGVPVAYLSEAIVAAAAPVEMTDDVSKEFIYAVVDSTDQTAVMNLIKIQPGPVVFVRDKGKWNEDEDMLSALRSVSPPMLVELAGDEISDVMDQVDSHGSAAGDDETEDIESEELIPTKMHVQDLPTPEEVGTSTKAHTVLAAVAMAQTEVASYETEVLAQEQALERQLEELDETYIKRTDEIRTLWSDEGVDAQELMYEARDEYHRSADAIRDDLEALRLENEKNLKTKKGELQETIVAAAAILQNRLARLESLENATMVAAQGIPRGVPTPGRARAEPLRSYWTKGKGALKIRWGTSGDWRRCVRQLRRYIGVRAKGYCQHRHADVMGFYTGDKRNR